MSEWYKNDQFFSADYLLVDNMFKKLKIEEHIKKLKDILSQYWGFYDS